MKSIGCALSPHGDGLFFILKNLECLKDNSSAVDMGAAVRLWDLEGRTCTAGLGECERTTANRSGQAVSVVHEELLHSPVGNV